MSIMNLRQWVGRHTAGTSTASLSGKNKNIRTRFSNLSNCFFYWQATDGGVFRYPQTLFCFSAQLGFTFHLFNAIRTDSPAVKGYCTSLLDFWNEGYCPTNSWKLIFMFPDFNIPLRLHATTYHIKRLGSAWHIHCFFCELRSHSLYFIVIDSSRPKTKVQIFCC